MRKIVSYLILYKFIFYLAFFEDEKSLFWFNQFKSIWIFLNNTKIVLFTSGRPRSQPRHVVHALTSPRHPWCMPLAPPAPSPRALAALSPVRRAASPHSLLAASLTRPSISPLSRSLCFGQGWQHRSPLNFLPTSFQPPQGLLSPPFRLKSRRQTPPTVCPHHRQTELLLCVRIHQSVTATPLLQWCDRTTLRMRGLSPEIISGDSRWSENMQTQHIQAYKYHIWSSS
jgi:hypothetical protein